MLHIEFCRFTYSNSLDPDLVDIEYSFDPLVP